MQQKLLAWGRTVDNGLFNPDRKNSFSVFRLLLLWMPTAKIILTPPRNFSNGLRKKPNIGVRLMKKLSRVIRETACWDYVLASLWRWQDLESPRGLLPAISRGWLASWGEVP